MYPDITDTMEHTWVAIIVATVNRRLKGLVWINVGE
jgi:hypothetical protein